ncbi:hypothetical protein E4Z66_11175 [Aliishimia ponticola]|uniref:Uncharacterized protein n=1 Tax=Aliishimia ponticola TaxID=2499833 RepID=A0A4S4NC92_9RHOB|nr:hypothetical protein [Aliishimia ponticola]THH35651.1 hypothetical protein E4Z66_11175 [Aliishimia ponticola]
MGVEFLLYLAAPCVVAFLVSFLCQSRLARRILRWGAAVFLTCFVVAAMIEGACSGGSLLKGLGKCSPAWVHDLGRALETPLVLSVIAYPFVGPALLLAASLLEMVQIKARR